MPTIDKHIQQIFGIQSPASVIPDASALLARVATVSFVIFAPNAGPDVSGRKEAA
jgi:hypothetical protein